MMKYFRTGSILALVLALVMLFGVTESQAAGSWTNNAVKSYADYNQVLRFTCTVDSIDTLTSSAFTLGKYDHVNWTSFPFSLEYQVTSTAGTPKLTAYIHGSMDGSTYTVVDTLISNFTTETLTKATIDFNNKKYIYYKLIIYGVATNRNDTAFDMRMLLYQEGY